MPHSTWVRLVIEPLGEENPCLFVSFFTRAIERHGWNYVLLLIDELNPAIDKSVWEKVLKCQHNAIHIPSHKHIWWMPCGFLDTFTRHYLSMQVLGCRDKSDKPEGEEKTLDQGWGGCGCQRHTPAHAYLLIHSGTLKHKQHI